MAKLDMINKLTKLLILLLIVFQFFDGAFTICGIIDHGSTEIEANPIIRFLCNRYGFIESIIFVKSIAICILFWVYITIKYTKNLTFLFLLFVTFLFYLYAIVTWSYYFVLALA